MNGKSSFPVQKSDQEWREQLSAEEYRILRESGTERAFTGEYDKHYDVGTYSCAGCDTDLFDSEQKYNSGCGWPAFWGELNSAGIKRIADNSFGMRRVELVCGNCGGHLGHVFNDGPPPTGERYCINSVSMKFRPK